MIYAGCTAHVPRCTAPYCAAMKDIIIYCCRYTSPLLLHTHAPALALHLCLCCSVAHSHPCRLSSPLPVPWEVLIFLSLSHTQASSLLDPRRFFCFQASSSLVSPFSLWSLVSSNKAPSPLSQPAASLLPVQCLCCEPYRPRQPVSPPNPCAPTLTSPRPLAALLRTTTLPRLC